MHNYNDLLNSIKIASVGAVEASQPVNIVFGTVINTSPLKINIEQKLTLGTAQLILTRNVTDFYADMSVDHLTENRSGGGGESAFSSHDHEYKGRKTFLVHNTLVVGDEVLMLRMQGGQKYIVLDRVVTA